MGTRVAELAACECVGIGTHSTPPIETRAMHIGLTPDALQRTHIRYCKKASYYKRKMKGLREGQMYVTGTNKIVSIAARLANATERVNLLRDRVIKVHCHP